MKTITIQTLMTGLTLCAAFAATTALAANGSYTTQSNAFVKWGNCAQEPQTCDGLEAASCQQKAQQTCDNDSECVGFTIRNHIGFWDDFLTYTDKTCVDENTYDDGHWTLHTKAAPAAPAGVNIAPLGKATQSTTAYNGVASRAIDGNTDGVYSAAHGSVTHTNGSNSWWQVALDATYQINDIRIYNRTGGRDEFFINRLTWFSVEILEDGQVVKSFGPFQVFSEDYFDVPGVNGATGNKVRISIPGHYLSLAEVEVYGELAKGGTVATVCDAGEFQTVAPTLTSDRICSPHSKPAPHQRIKTAGTALADAVIENTCSDSEWYDNGNCKALTVCDATQEQSQAPTATSDRVCGLIPQTVTYEYQAGSRRSDQDWITDGKIVGNDGTVLDVTYNTRGCGRWGVYCPQIIDISNLSGKVALKGLPKGTTRVQFTSGNLISFAAILWDYQPKQVIHNLRYPVEYIRQPLEINILDQPNFDMKCPEKFAKHPSKEADSTPTSLNFTVKKNGTYSKFTCQPID